MSYVSFLDVVGGDGFRIGFPTYSGNIKKGFGISPSPFAHGGIVITQEQALEIAHFIIAEVVKNTEKERIKEIKKKRKNGN